VRLVITPEESARLDATANGPALMERAGWGVALEAVRMGARYGTNVTVLVGPGNNGGDGYTAAGLLAARGVGVEVLALAKPKAELARQAAERVRRVVPVRPFRLPTDNDQFVIDALFGGGLRAGLAPDIRKWVSHHARVLSVDFPTGVDPLTGAVDDMAFSAESTVTFHALRPGHLLGEGPERCGRLIVADIGLEGGEPTWKLAEESDTSRPRRPIRGHKWSVGSTLVVGGSEGMIGAAVMAGRSALAFGAGSVGIASPRVDLVQGAAPEILAYPIDDLPEKFGSLVVGPGLGVSAETVMDRLANDLRPAVVDADAIAHFPKWPVIRAARTVVTPHAREFETLTGEEATPDAAVRFARSSGAIVLLKGNPTFVTDGRTPWVITTNGPELSTIGTGDVLAGMIGALLGRGVAPLTAAITGAYWHGRSGTEVGSEGCLTIDHLIERIRIHAFEEPR